MAKLRRELYMGSESPIASGDGGLRLLLDTSKFNSGTYYFEISVYNGESSARDVVLHNSNHGVEATITVPAYTTTYTRFRTSFTPNNTYPEKHLSYSTAPLNLQVYARIVIVQDTGGSALTASQGLFNLGRRQGLGMTTPTVDTPVDGNYWFYTAANLDGATKTFEAEVVYYTTSSKNLVTIKLQEDNGSYTFSDKVTVVNAETAITPTRVRVSFTPVDGRHYRFVFRGSATKYETYILESRVIITQADATAITKFEDVHEWATTASNVIGLYDPNEWSIQHNHYPEHTAQSANTNTFQQAKNGSWATLPNSSITGPGSLQQIRGSTAITMPTSAKDIRPNWATTGAWGVRIVAICVVASQAFEYLGNITLSLTPSSTKFADYVAPTPTATVALTPTSIYGYGYFWDGNIILSLTPGAIHFANYAYLGNIPIQFIPNSIYSFGLYEYLGSITLTLLPAADYSFTRILGLTERGDLIIREAGGYGMAITESGELALLTNIVTESGRFINRARPNVSQWAYAGTISIELTPASPNFAEFPNYSASVGLILTPQSSFFVDVPPYQGNLIVSLTPASLYQYGFFYTGTVAVSLLLSSTAFVTYVFTGAITLSIIPEAADYHYGVEAVYEGNIPLALTPQASYGPEWALIGGIAVEIIPTSSYFRDFLYQASVPLEIIPNPSYFWVPIYSYDGDVAFSLLPASDHFGDYIYYGALLTSLLPSSPHLADYVFGADQILNVLPQSFFAPGWTVTGAIDVTLLPGADYKQDFYLIGDVLVRLLPGSTHLANYIYSGFIQLLLGLLNLDAQEAIELFFFDSIESGSMPPAPQGIYPYPVIETKTLPAPTETVIYIETEERVK